MAMEALVNWRSCTICPGKRIYKNKNKRKMQKTSVKEEEAKGIFSLWMNSRGMFYIHNFLILSVFIMAGLFTYWKTATVLPFTLFVFVNQQCRRKKGAPNTSSFLKK